MAKGDFSQLGDKNIKVASETPIATNGVETPIATNGIEESGAESSSV